MVNGWTGGQYSVYRGLLGAYLVTHFLANPSVKHVAGAAGALLLLAGFHDKLGALFVACVLLVSDPSLRFLAAAPAVHLVLPPDPYGAWWARGRPDPGGGWRFPAWLFTAAWAGTCLWYALRGIFVEDGTALRILELAYAPLALSRRARPWIWLVMLLWLLVSGEVGRVLVHLLTLDRGWVPGRWPQRRDLVLFDGTCALCHGVIRFLLSEDRVGTAFVYAPLPEGKTAETVQVSTESGALLARSDAVLYLLERLGALWRVLGVASRVVPRTLRDTIYDLVARHRYRVFGRTASACPVLPESLRARFQV